MVLRILKHKNKYTMKNKLLLICIAGFCLLACKKDRKRNSKPNVVYILADDLGYGELGVYGQKKIKTPNIDALAAKGMLFTQHYSGSPVCAPSRYMLLTGKHSGHAKIRGNDEWASRGDVWNYAKAVQDPNLEGQRPISPKTPNVAKLFKKAGYTTAIIGKWGLGAPNTEGIPNNVGFDFFYGYNCQRQAHQLYPKHLWKNREKEWLNNELVPSHSSLDKGADPYDIASYKKFEQKDYAPQKMQTEALRFIESNKDNRFFLYYASPLPHLPLQIPQSYTQKYVKEFGEEEPYKGGGYFPNRYPKAAYAAMISYLDAQVGELVKKLKSLGIYKNTLIIFTSDNGPTYNIGGVDAAYFNSTGIFSNTYGRTKGFVYEGGIRVPMIATWEGHIKAGSRTDHISAFWDVLPTVADLLGVPKPEHIDGKSFLPTLVNEPNKQAQHPFLYWEFPAYKGQQAVRMGKYKGIRKDIFKGNMSIELYDLSKDPAEQNNIAAQNPEVVDQIRDIMQKEHTNPVIERFKMKPLGDK